MVTLPVFTSPIVAVIVVSIGYGVGSVAFPLVNSAISQICPPRQLAAVLGIFLALMATGGLIAPYMTGAIVEAAPSPATGYATAFQVLGALALIGGTAAIAFMNPERDARLIGAAGGTGFGDPDLDDPMSADSERKNS